MTLNKVMLIGNIGQEPVVKYLDQGVCVATLTLATSERGYTLQNGTQVPERTEWHNVVVWRQPAEFVEKYVHKGDTIYVEGKIQSRSYTDRQGLQRRVVEIMAERLELITSRTPYQGNVAQQAIANTGAAVKTGPLQNAQSQSTPVKPSAPAQEPSDEGEYPF